MKPLEFMDKIFDRCKITACHPNNPIVLINEMKNLKNILLLDNEDFDQRTEGQIARDDSLFHQYLDQIRSRYNNQKTGINQSKKVV